MPAVTAQWHFIGYENASDGGTPPDISSDWLYAVKSTSKKEYVACGYTHLSAGGALAAAILKLDHLGKMKWSRRIDISAQVIQRYDFSSSPTASPVTETVLSTSRVFDVTETDDGYITVGNCSAGGILIAEIDALGNFINGTPIIVKTPYVPTSGITIPTTDGGDPVTTTAAGYTVAYDHNTKDVIIGCRIFGNKFGAAIAMYNMAGVVTLKHPTSPGGNWTMGGSYYSGSYGSVVNKVLTKSTGGSSYDIFGCGVISATGDNAITFLNNSDPVLCTLQTFNKDVWIIKTTNTYSSVATDQYDKSNIKVNVSGTPTAINTSYTNTLIYPYQETGPVSARNYNTSNGRIICIDPDAPTVPIESPATVPLNALNNQCEMAFDMTFTNDNKLAVTALVNCIGGISKGRMGATLSKVVKTGYKIAPHFNEYTDGDCFLMKIDPADIGVTTSTTLAKNVGHFSGADYWPQVRQTAVGTFIVAGSTADQYGSSDYNFMPEPDIANGWGNALIILTEDDFSSGAVNIARRSFTPKQDAMATQVGPGTGGTDPNNHSSQYCLFGMDLTADGGFVICGDNYNNADDHIVTKFAPLLQQRMVAQGLYEKFGLGYTPATYTLAVNETWSSATKYIGSKVIVPSGKTLTINNSTIMFAASDHLWDYWHASVPFSAGGIGCGIVVEPGGYLVIENNSYLGSIDVVGFEHNMWDGIVVHGNPASSSVGGQGRVKIDGGSIIESARYGLYVADNYRTYVTHTSVDGTTYGWTYGSRYDGYASMGGGRVLADNTTFSNCRYGVNFQNAPIAGYASSFESCTFTSDAGGMGDICFYTDANGGLVPANTHFAAWNVKTIRLHGNDFTCNTAFDESVRPVGIVSHTTGIRITDNPAAIGGAIPGNTFSNLVCGISAENPPGISPMINIRDNTFDNNTYGANIQGAHYGLIVKDNTFGLPPYLFDLDIVPTGITLAGCKGYDVSFNTASTCSTCPPGAIVGNYGIVINNGHTANEKIEKNTFELVSAGTLPLATNGVGDYTSGVKSGLTFKCNNYNQCANGISRASRFAGTSLTIPCTIHPEQGFCFGPADPAGNQFHACYSNQRIFPLDADVDQVVRYNNNGASTVFDPGTCIFTHNTWATSPPLILINNACTGLPTSIEDACPTPYIYGDWGSPGMASAKTHLAVLDYDLSVNSDPDIAIALETQRDDVLGYMARFYSDSGSYDTVAALLASYGKNTDALPFYIMAGDYQTAASIVNNLPAQTSEEQLFKYQMELAIDLYSQGENWMSIDSATRDTLMHIVQYNSVPGYMAGAISALVGTGPVTWPIPLIDSAVFDSLIIDTTGQGQKMAHGNHCPTVKDIGSDGRHMFSLFPNPTNGSFSLLTSASGTFIVTTMDGKKITEHNVRSGVTEIKLPTSIANGLYMGVFRPADNGIPNVVRFVYQR